VSLGTPRREGQDGIEAVERLDGGLLIHAENGRVLRGIEIEADHVRGLLLEIGIVGGHVALEPMRPEARAFPYPRDHHVIHTQRVGQLAAAPVRGPVGGGAASPRQDLRFDLGGALLNPPAAMTRKQTRQPLRCEALLPAQNVGGAAAERRLDCGPGRPISQHQNQTSAAHVVGAKHP
jgi:hypothetical protein